MQHHDWHTAAGGGGDPRADCRGACGAGGCYTRTGGDRQVNRSRNGRIGRFLHLAEQVPTGMRAIGCCSEAGHRDL